MIPPLLGAAGPPRATGMLEVDAADPVVAVTIAGVPLRLRVDLAAQDAVELNPGAAARLPLRWQDDLAIDVGRVRLPGRVALATLRIDGRDVPVEVAEHGRDCCTASDGAIGPGLLPYATIRWHRADAPAPVTTRALSLDYAPETGLSAAVEGEVAGVRVRFDPAQAGTSATAAAGAILARGWGGHWAGPPTRMTAAFGVERPVRPLAFDRPGTLAGFAVATLPIRIADFAGRARLPGDPVQPDDIVVAHHVRPQHGWPAVTIGADRLARCRDILFTAEPRGLMLACAP